ncbi:MAG: hypothetical protein LJE65_07725 [Desulfobacteraceae bacterium]|nr:hypothetical protein [Desulfobacteraceae bacterium]
MPNDEAAKRFNYFFGLINLAVAFCIFWFLWYVFMNPNTVMKLYTPMYGFALVAVFLSGLILLTRVLEYDLWATGQSGVQNRVFRGILWIALSFLLMIFINYFLFWGFIGKFGIAYFSPDSIVAGGGIGAEPFVARENASTAVLYYCAAFLWIALFWDLGFGKWPWQKAGTGVRVWSKLFAVTFFTTLFYIILFHPHVCYLFYPAQSKAGVMPWWETMAGTGSAFFSLGLILCTLLWIVFSDQLWEGHPWKRLEENGEGTFVKGFGVFIGTLTLGVILLFIFTKIFNLVWEEPFVGGQYTDGPDWRYIHAGEIAGFFILAAFILRHYFNNFPNTKNLWLRCVIRTLIAVAGGMLIYWFYYSPLATFFLAKVEGFAQPGDTPLVWTLLFLSLIIIQAEFFDGWPIKANSKGKRP